MVDKTIMVLRPNGTAVSQPLDGIGDDYIRPDDIDFLSIYTTGSPMLDSLHEIPNGLESENLITFFITRFVDSKQTLTFKILLT